MSTSSTDSLTNHFLVAMPGIKDPIFSESVIYLCSHSQKGATGLVINKPLVDVSIQNLLDRFDIQATGEQPDWSSMPVLCGGPLGREKSFVFHPARICKQMVEVSEPEMALVELVEGRGPENFLVTLGYSHWEGGELEQEMIKSHWLIAPAHFQVLFQTPFERRWREAGALAGVDFNHVSPLVGHA